MPGLGSPLFGDHRTYYICNCGNSLQILAMDTPDHIATTASRYGLRSGTSVGPYTIASEIDRGGMAIVYRARHNLTARIVALKVLAKASLIDESLIQRFIAEAQAIATLNHPGIVKIIDAASDDAHYYIAMEFLHGANLYYYLHQYKPKLREVLQIIISVADALSYAHSRGILHRDLKLNNILMRENKTATLIDFGLAKSESTQASQINTKRGHIVGSPCYMASEVLQGQPASVRSEVCALGIILYELLTFQNPYIDHRNPHQTSLNAIAATPVHPRKLVPWLDDEICAIALKAMHKQPSQRYHSMEDFSLDLRRYRRGEQIVARPESLFKRGILTFKKFWPIFSIASLLTALAVLGYFSFFSSKRTMGHWMKVYDQQNTQHISAQNPGTIPVALDPACSIAVMVNRSLLSQGTWGISIGDSSGLNGYRLVISSLRPNLATLFYPQLKQSFTSSFFTPKSRINLAIKKDNGHIHITAETDTLFSLPIALDLLGSQGSVLRFFTTDEQISIERLEVFHQPVAPIENRMQLADIFMHYGYFSKADDLYNQVISTAHTNAQSARAEAKRAEILFRQGTHTEAAGYIDTLLQKQLPLRTGELQILDITNHYMLHQYFEADAQIVRILTTQKPLLSPLLHQYAQLLITSASSISTKEVIECLAPFSSSVFHHSLGSELLRHLQREYFRTGGIDSALFPRLEMLFYPSPALRAQLYTQFAYFNLLEKKFDKALDLIELSKNAIGNVPQRWTIELCRATVLAAAGDQNEALRIVEDIARDAPHHLWAHMVCSQITSQRKKRMHPPHSTTVLPPIIAHLRASEHAPQSLEHKTYDQMLAGFEPLRSSLGMWPETGTYLFE